MIHIHLYANLRTITGQTQLVVKYSNAKTMRELLARLIEQFPEIKHHLLDKHENLYPDVPIFVNGRNPRLTGAGMDLSIKPGDEISLFSPISSGRMNVEVMRPSKTNLPEDL